MKRKQLLSKLSRFLSADEDTQKREIEDIRKVLKLLKKKEHKLKEKLARDPEGPDAQRIATQLRVIYVQRTRGIERVRELREGKGGASA